MTKQRQARRYRSSVRKYYAVLGIVMLVVAVGYAFANGWIKIPGPSNGANGANGNGNGFPPSGSLPLSWQKYPNNPLSLPLHGGQGVVHPDVLYFPSGKDGFKFWMIYTPYPGDYDENPCVVRSNDGISWSETGISNPVIPRNVGSWNAHHNADPDWLYIPEYGKWFVAWSVVPTPGTCHVAFSYSTDGIQWNFNVDWGYGSPVLIQSASEPTMIFENGRFQLIYGLEGGDPNGHAIAGMSFAWDNSANRVVDKRSEMSSWLAPASSGDIRSGVGHIDLVRSGGTYYLIGPRRSPANPMWGGVVFAWQSSNVLSWREYGVLLTTGTGWDSNIIYRSSLLQDCYGNLVTHDGKFWIYYSAYQGSIPRIGFATAS